jgi:sortase A
MSIAHRASGMIAAVLLAFALWQIAEAGWIHAKAFLAQRLIASAWARADGGGSAPRPWPWADMRPIARLAVMTRGIELFVLDNASPRALAFGPAHMGGTAAPGDRGNSVIVAHRDTHFAFLRHLQLDDEIEVHGARGIRARYRVSEMAVVHERDTRVLEAADASQLTLITCYPFDAVFPGTQLRYVVVAERIAQGKPFAEGRVRTA